MSEGVSTEPSTNARQGFFAARWRGEVPLSKLFWRDLVLVGSAINVVTTIVALVVLGLKAPAEAALAVHFAALPYNLFLFLAVWRTAEKTRPAIAWIAQLGAAAWLLLATTL